MLENLKALSEIPGVSGNERQVAQFIAAKAKNRGFNVELDSLGNVLAWKEGEINNSAPRLLLSGHMDEVGLIISHIEKCGHLKFYKVGGLEDKTLLSKTVLIGKNNIAGVIGAKAIHLQKKEERKKELSSDEMYIDIGAKDKEEAKKHINMGDYVSFYAQPSPAGDGYFKGKALDNRAGCAVLLKLMDTHYPGHVCFAFTVQEEIGLRGAATAAYWFKPEMALVVDTTSAADVPEAKEHQKGTILGKGPALTFMDQSIIVSPQLVRRLSTIAQKEKIPFQYRSFTGGATDAGRIATTAEGVSTAVVSIPCRYIHSPVSLLNLADLHSTAQLVEQFIVSL